MADSTWWIIEAIGSVLIFAILVGMWAHLHPRPERRVWQCVRYQGGGMLSTPRQMSIEEVTEWLGKINSEVAHIDYEHGFIFYRARGG